MISVIIPAYNQADKITKTLTSLERQSYRDFEVIIVDDGSTDNLSETVGHYLEKSKMTNSFFIFRQKNSGAPAARNTGFLKSRGEFLFFLDSDVILAPNAFKTFIDILSANPGASYSYSSFYFGKKLFRLEPFSQARLRRAPFISTMSLIKRSDFPAEMWDESLKKFQDWDLYLTMLEHDHRGVYIDKPLWQAITGGTMSAWLPSLAYKLLPWLPQVRRYNEALAVIKAKHKL